MALMNKRIIASTVAVAALFGLGGTALAATGGGTGYDIQGAALSLATDPPPPAPAPMDPSKRQQLKDCVKAKIDSGGDKRAAVKDCRTQLGIPPRRKGVRPLFKTVHADLIVPKKGSPGQFETVQVDRGTVTAASADSVSLQRPDGPTVTVKVVPATKVKGVAAVADLAPGRHVAVVSAGGEARAVAAKP